MGLALVWLNGQYQANLQTAQAGLIKAAQAGSEAVHQDLRTRMVGNDRSNIRFILADANQVPGLQRVLVIGPNGHVYLDSWGRSVDSTLATTLPNCVECHQQAKPPTATTLAYNASFIRVASPITNDTRCSSCHASSNANLGVVLVDVSQAGIQAEASRIYWIGFAIALSLALVVGLIAFWALRFVPLPTLSPRLPLGRAPVPNLAALVRNPRVVWLVTGLLVAGVAAIGGGTVSAQLESQDAFCTSCHTQPETAYYERTQASATDLASAHTPHNVLCIDCHSGAGLLGRAGAISQGAQNLALFASGHYASPAVLKNKIPDEACLKCHAETTSDSAPANHFHYYLALWQAADPQADGCASCHAGHTTGGPPDRGFLQNVAVDAVCQECHATAKTAR